jgi:FlaA1/EpsC-like NDP-sugar epimerase
MFPKLMLCAQGGGVIRRLGLYEFVFRICCFPLPSLAFLIGCVGLRPLALIRPLSRDYLYLVVTLSLVWIVCSVHFRVTSVEALFLDSDGVRNCLKALAWTYMSGFSALFFYRGASYSRLLLGASALILFGEVIFVRIAFRSIVRRSAKRREQIRVIIVGADAFAQETSERLKNCAVAPCETVAFVRMPGQGRRISDSEQFK